MERLLEILALLENPTGLTDPQIGELESELQSIYTGIRAGDIEVELEEGQSLLDAVRPIATGVENLRALAAERIQAAATLEAELAQLELGIMPSAAEDTEGDAAAAAAAAAAAGEEGGDDDGAAGEGEGAGEGAGEGVTVASGEGDEPAGEPAGAGAEGGSAPVPVTASGRPPLGAVAQFQQATTRPRPSAPERRDPHARIVAADGEVISASQIGEVMSRRFGDLGMDAGKRTLVSIKGEYGDSHKLDATDERGNGRKLDAIAEEARGDEAWRNAPVTAAGLGWCTPSQVTYEEVVQSLGARPMTAALPSVQVDRGGVRVPVSPTLADIDGVQSLADADHNGTAVTVYTEADDIAVDPEDESTLKPVQKITCPTWAEFRTYAIVKRLRFGNMAARANPENVAAWNQLANARYARVAETKILDLIKGDAGTTRIEQPTAILGSSRDFLELVLRMASAMRNSERADDGSGGGPRIRVAAPSWVIGDMQSDLLRTFRDDVADGDLVVPRNVIVNMLTNVGVNPTFYIDSPSRGPSQLLPKQTADGAPSQWPCEVQFGMWFEGHFAHGDEGQIDLGVVRDRGLNEQNDFETFTESFETVIARRGPEALWITQKLVPDGSYSTGIDINGDIDCLS